MNLFQWYVIVTLIINIGLAAIFAKKQRKTLDHMAKMTISMFFGMNIGLTVGVLFGSIYQGNLFQSTLLSMAIGILASAVIGIIFGLISMVEGIMAGLMGGMMGAMLGEMITPSQSTLMIKIFLTLSISSLFLFKIFISQPIETTVINSKKWLWKPLSILFFLSIYLIGGRQLETMTKHSQKIETDHSHPKNHFIINVGAGKFTYSPNHLVIPKGHEITLTLKNEDEVDHDIEINNLTFIRSESIHQKNHHGSSTFHLHSKPNSESSITFTPLKAGIYHYSCTISGHRENGMMGTIIVK